MTLPEPLRLFPVYRARAVYEHRTVFSAHTQNRKLADCEEIFSEFEVFWIRIVDYSFNFVKLMNGSNSNIKVCNRW